MLQSLLMDRLAVEKLTQCLEVIGITFFKSITLSNRPSLEPFSKMKIMLGLFLEQFLIFSVRLLIKNIGKFTVLFSNSTMNRWWIFSRMTKQKSIRKWSFMRARMMAFTLKVWMKHKWKIWIIALNSCKEARLIGLWGKLPWIQKVVDHTHYFNY